MSIHELEQRVATLEEDVAQLKRELLAPAPTRNWIQKITGSFEDDPDFEEILRLGRESRAAQRPETHG